MRGVRVRELLLIVAVVALAVVWPLSVTRLATRSEVAELELGAALDRAELAEERLAAMTTSLAECEETLGVEQDHLDRVERLLAECEGRRPDATAR